MTGGSKQPRIRAKLEIDYHDRIHNDLGNAAWYFEERIRKRLEADDRAGIAYDMMAALVMTAFSFEAYINFLGQACVQGWRERQPFDNKVVAVLGALSLSPDMTARPYSTIARLKQFRDGLAHGKPSRIVIEEEAEGTHDELTKRLRDFAPARESSVTAELVTETYDDIEAIWKEMLAASGLREFDTWSGGMSGLEFIDYADQGSDAPR